MVGDNEESSAIRQYNFANPATVIGIIREPQTEGTSVYKALFPQGAGSALAVRDECNYVEDLKGQWAEVGKRLIYNPLLVGQTFDSEDHVFIKEIFDGDIEAIRWAVYPYLFATHAAITDVYKRAGDALDENSQGKVLFGEKTLTTEEFLEAIFTKDENFPNEINYVQAGLLVVTEDLDVSKLGGELTRICEDAERTEKRGEISLEKLTYNVLAKQLNNVINILYLQMAGRPETVETLYDQQIKLVGRQVEEMSDKATVIGYPPILEMREPALPEPEELPELEERVEAKPEELGILGIEVEKVEVPIGDHEVSEISEESTPEEEVEPEEPSEA